jgi:hypothetical protein
VNAKIDALEETKRYAESMLKNWNLTNTRQQSSYQNVIQKQLDL